MMAHCITGKELQEIKSILRDGRYFYNGSMRVHVEFLALAFSKYLLFSGIESWRQGATKPFDQCLLGKGQRTQAIRYLIEKKILIYDNNRRTRTNDFIENVNLLEKEIKEKKREGELF